MKKQLISLLTLMLVIAIGLWGCQYFDLSSDRGTLAIYLADFPVNDVANVYVTLSEVQVKQEDKPWQTIQDFGEEGETFDLLTLRFDEALLGEEMLEEGEYKEIRLILDASERETETYYREMPPYSGEKSYIVMKDTGDKIPIFVPSGAQTGLKIKHTFNVEVDTITELILDVDVREMLKGAGQSGIIILHPHAIKVVEKGDTGSIAGRVIDSDTDGAIIDSDVLIKALSDGEDAASAVALVEEDVYGNPPGSFKLRGLDAGEFTIFVEADGYLPYLSEDTVVVEKGSMTDLIGPIQLEKDEE